MLFASQFSRIAIAAAMRLGVYVKGKNAKKFRKNMEYGSARWGTTEDIKPYVDPVFANNIILGLSAAPRKALCCLTMPTTETTPPF